MQTPEKIALGKKLFFDQRLSADGNVSCATCHDENRAFADGLPVAEGIRKQRGTRNTPTIINAAFFTSQFWDGRRATLEEQARDPFVNGKEHGFRDHQTVLAVIRTEADYPAEFQRIFGTAPGDINIDHVTQALASYERTLIMGDSSFDRYQYGNDKTAITPAALRGLDIFRGRAHCDTCHVIGEKYALFTDNQFHSAGVGLSRIESRLAQITTRAIQATGKKVTELNSSAGQQQRLDETIFTDAEIAELGRFMVTTDPADIGRFKTPSLRNIAHTAPYMHDGSLNTLTQVIDVELYVRGNESNRPLILTPSEKNDLTEFLNSLTSARVQFKLPGAVKQIENLKHK